MKRYLFQVLFICAISMTMALLYNQTLHPPLQLFTATAVDPTRTTNAISASPIIAIDEIDADTLQQLLSHDEVVLLDARPEADFAEDRIPGARSLPVGRFAERFATVMGSIPTDRTIVVYCSESSCQDSTILAEKLIARGYLSVMVFKGGMVAWREIRNAPRFEEDH